MSSSAPVILLVEDDALLRDSAAFALREAGYQAVCVASAHQAFSILSRVAPDLVLLDGGLPDRDGFDLGAWLKHAGIRFIFATGRSGADDIARGLALGAEDYLVKPFSLAELTFRVRLAVQRQIAVPGA